MVNNKQYYFSRGKDGYVIFDSNGYITDAKGFSFIIRTDSQNIDKDLIGKHVDELATMLKNKGANRDVYINFEIQVHIELLKEMLQNLKH